MLNNVFEKVGKCRELSLSKEDTLATLDGEFIGLAKLEDGSSICLDLIEEHIGRKVGNIRKKFVEITNLDIFDNIENLIKFIRENTNLKVDSLEIDF